MSKESLTPYSELDATLKDHAKILKEVLRENLIGFYLKDIAPIYWTVINEYGRRVTFFKDHLIKREFHSCRLPI
jgi:hypothetical protein